MPELKFIGDVAQELSTTPRTIRFYEEKGLVKTSRDQRGKRVYNETQVSRIQLILSMRAVGFTLFDISKIMGKSNIVRLDRNRYNEQLQYLTEQMDAICVRLMKLLEMEKGLFPLDARIEK